MARTLRSKLRTDCRPWRHLLAAVVLTSWSAFASAIEPQPQFERDVWPILATRCVTCHGADEPKGGLDLRTVGSMLRGGESGPALVKSDLPASLILEKIDQREMPPKGERQLSPDDIAVLRAWIAAGARAEQPDVVPPPVSGVSDRDRRFWSFRPLQTVPVPSIKQIESRRTPIDAFLLAKLEAKGLGFSSDAQATTLVRRLYLDLVGLPPEPAEIDAYLADHDPGAYERLVDRLLASPHFGERWGRHWLDVAGYVDTIGFDTDATNVMLAEGKWRYRDWVVRALNVDKPYDRFITEQLAGDELYDWRRAERFTPEIREALVATGYLRTARDLTHEDVGVIPQNFFGIMHDTLETMGTGLLGLTLNCARCHSHKFDPIPQEDYYRLMAILTPAYNPQAWRSVIPTETKTNDRAIPDVSKIEQAAIERHNAALDAQLQTLRQQLDDLRRPHPQQLFEAALAKLPEAIRQDTKGAIEAAADKRTPVQKYLVDKFGKELTPSREAIAAELNESDKASATRLEGEIAATEAGRLKWGKIQALVDVGPPPPTHLLMRGSEESPGVEVEPGFLRVLSRCEATALAAVTAPMEGTSGRRMALARWLTERDSPASALLARVAVNRVWQQIFGRGIVPTADNFGAQGQPPTHPELLEWLSARFVEGNWRVKPLIKLMVLSTAYRQTSRRDASGAPATIDAETIDPGNELLWRMRLRRLESEVVRDSILTVSGTLNRAMGGPPVAINARPDGMVVVAKERLAHPDEAMRRSIYLVTRRAYNLSLLTVFDQPLVATNCLKRDASAVPLQSLMMLNDTFIAEAAEQLVRRVEGSAATLSLAPTSPQEAIERLFRLALARLPNAAEAATCRQLVDEQTLLCRKSGASDQLATHQALVQLCQTVLNTSEFLYAE